MFKINGEVLSFLEKKLTARWLIAPGTLSG